MVKYIHRLRANIFYAIIFAILFIVGGYYIPQFYYQHIDSRKYVKIYHPITQVENRMYVNPDNYKPCENAKVFFVRDSEIDTTGIVEIGVFKIDEFEKDVYHNKWTVSVDKSRRNLSYNIPIKCNMEDGNYFIRGSLEYTYKGVEKTISFTTDNFKVQK